MQIWCPVLGFSCRPRCESIARNKNGSVLQVFNFHICYTEPYCTLKEGELKCFFHVHQTDECRNSGASLWGNMSSSKCERCSDGHLEMSIENISSIDLKDVFLETKLYLWLEDAWRVPDKLVYVRDWHKNNKTSVGIAPVLTTRFLLSTSSRTDLPAQFVKATLRDDDGMCTYSDRSKQLFSRYISSDFQLAPWPHTFHGLKRCFQEGRTPHDSTQETIVIHSQKMFGRFEANKRHKPVRYISQNPAWHCTKSFLHRRKWSGSIA